jgi:pimeloyl-ACP methyl ester carboxylesterase
MQHWEPVLQGLASVCRPIALALPINIHGPDVAVREAKRHPIDRLRAIKVPTLFAWGLEDRITPPRVAEYFRALIPDARVSYVARCGHIVMLERPAAFTAAVTLWLDATCNRSAHRLRGQQA